MGAAEPGADPLAGAAASGIEASGFAGLAMPVATVLTITVACSPRAGEVDERVVRMPVGATVGDALRASALCVGHPGQELHDLVLGVWGRRCGPERVLSDRDRVELYRPLAVDPKEARRLRYRATQRPAAAEPRRRRAAVIAPAEPIGAVD